MTSAGRRSDRRQKVARQRELGGEGQEERGEEDAEGERERVGRREGDGGERDLRVQEGGQRHVGHQRRAAGVDERVDLLCLFTAGFNLRIHRRPQHTHPLDRLGRNRALSPCRQR